MNPSLTRFTNPVHVEPDAEEQLEHEYEKADMERDLELMPFTDDGRTVLKED
jgi:hypothetical protein